MTVEQPPPARFEPSSKPYWTSVKIVALILIILVAVSATGVGLYYRLAPANVVSRATTCSNGATNPPSCTIYGDCSNGAINPPSCTTYLDCFNGAINPPSCTSCTSGQSFVSGACHTNCSNGATNPPSCNNVCTNGATNFPACNSYPPCSNGATNPPNCNNNTGTFCLAFNFGDAEYSRNSTGWYITLSVQNYCSDRSLYVSRVSINQTNQPSAKPFQIYVNGTTFPGPWTLPAGYAPYPPFYSGPPPTDIVICMSCAGQVFVPCAIYWITVWVTGSGTSSGATTTQSRGYGWECA